MAVAVHSQERAPASELTLADVSTSQRLELTAEVLKSAGPWIRQFRDKMILIKVGGSTFEPGREDEVQCMAADIALLGTLGMQPVVAHGGGKDILAALDAAGKVSHKVDTLRVSPLDHMPIIQNTLENVVGRRIKENIEREGVEAVQVSGSEIFRAELINFEKYGYVGEVVEVNVESVQAISESGAIPIVSPLGRTADGHVVNINADSATKALAIASEVDRLILVSDSAVHDADGERISSMTPSEVRKNIVAGVVRDGMERKTLDSVDIVESGKVGAVSIIRSDTKHRIITELLTDQGIGTQIVPEKS